MAKKKKSFKRGLEIGLGVTKPQAQEPIAKQLETTPEAKQEISVTQPPAQEETPQTVPKGRKRGRKPTNRPKADPYTFRVWAGQLDKLRIIADYKRVNVSDILNEFIADYVKKNYKEGMKKSISKTRKR